MKYPSYTDYCAMYQKYMNHQNLLDMMDLAGKDYSGKNFLDVCCGSMEAIKEAQKRNAQYCLGVDQEITMIPTEMRDFLKTTKISQRTVEYLSLPIEKCFARLGKKRFDIIFCRQGVNYWMANSVLSLLSTHMNKDGVFVFNTFNTKPSKEPTRKEYKIKDVSFVEISYLVNKDIVHHIQIREEYPPHLTEFKWISRKQFKKYLCDYFDFEIIEKGKTDIYICRKQ